MVFIMVLCWYCRNGEGAQQINVQPDKKNKSRLDFTGDEENISKRRNYVRLWVERGNDSVFGMFVREKTLSADFGGLPSIRTPGGRLQTLAGVLYVCNLFFLQ